MALVPDVKEGDWHGLNKILKKLSTLRLGSESTPTFGGLTINGDLSVSGTVTLTGLTASRLVSTDAAQGLESSDLYAWVTQTSNQVLIADDGDGTITFSTPQDIHTGASPTFSALTITNDTATKTLTITEPAQNYIFGASAEIGANGMSLVNSNASVPYLLNLHKPATTDTQIIQFNIFGKQNGATATEVLRLAWVPSAYYLIATAQSGTGTPYPLHLGTPSNSSQLVLNTNSTINTVSDVTVGGDLYASDDIFMSGATPAIATTIPGASLAISTSGAGSTGGITLVTGIATVSNSGDVSIGTGTAGAGTVGSIFLKTGGVTAVTIDESQNITVADGRTIESSKYKLTAIGGLAIMLTNKTGTNTVAGQLVKADTATDDGVILAAIGDTECFGVFLDAGVAADAEAWVVVSGIADVALDDNVAAVHSNWMATGVAAGYARTSASPAAAPGHFEEIGHCIESVSATGGGTHILARCVLHFN